MFLKTQDKPCDMYQRDLRNVDRQGKFDKTARTKLKEWGGLLESHFTQINHKERDKSMLIQLCGRFGHAAYLITIPEVHIPLFKVRVIRALKLLISISC